MHTPEKQNLLPHIMVDHIVIKWLPQDIKTCNKLSGLYVLLSSVQDLYFYVKELRILS